MQADSSIAPLLYRVALAGLIALMLVSLAFVGAAAASAGLRGWPPGATLAAVKVVVLSVLFRRVVKRDVYSLQWSSMLILLFVAEGTVRAASDPQPSAALGWIEAGAAVLYFAAVLGILRPLKARARVDKDAAR